MPSYRGQRVFVDSSAAPKPSAGYPALLDRDNERHEDAIAILRSLAGQRYRQFTSNVLIVQAHALRAPHRKIKRLIVQ
ncbi:MAG: hypothetical protein M3Z66_00280 [Chloroflexota bacterium]|nr:hypothetical protein [Chloroflexota bacterium]